MMDQAYVKMAGSAPPPDALLDRIGRMEERLGNFFGAAGDLADRLDGIQQMLNEAEARMGKLSEGVADPRLSMASPIAGPRPY